MEKLLQKEIPKNENPNIKSGLIAIVAAFCFVLMITRFLIKAIFQSGKKS